MQTTLLFDLSDFTDVRTHANRIQIPTIDKVEMLESTAIYNQPVNANQTKQDTMNILECEVCESVAAVV